MVIAGEFAKALELLRKQLGINNFETLKSAFVDIHTLGQMKMQTMPHLQAMDYQLRFKQHPLAVLGL